MTQIDGLVDLSQLVDFDAPVLCDSRKCETPGEVAIAMIVYKYCVCRYPLGLSCVQRLTREYADKSHRNTRYLQHLRCGTPLNRITIGPDYYKIVPL